MRKLKQSTLVTAIVSAGLLSAVICQCSMQMALVASSSHHCDPEEENVPVEPCCRVMRAAELRIVKAIVVIPEAVRADLVETVVASLPQGPRVPEKLAHPPPGNRGILHQTCSLLI